MKVCDYIAKFVADIGVDTVFTVSGGGCVFLVDAFGRQERIKLIANHHEQASALAAEGYARMKNSLGVCLVTSGPGGSNAYTGALCSYQDSIPTMIISGNVNKDMTTNYTKLNLRQLGDQEFNTTAVAKNFTKYAVQVNDESKIRYVMERAYYTAIHGRPGPVWVDVPLDISNKNVDIDSLEGFVPTKKKFTLKNANKSFIIDKIKKSRKPLIIVGNGVRLGNSTKLLNKFINKLRIPVVTSLNGNDVVSNEYEFHGGRFGLIGNISANKLIQEADFVLSLGSRLYVRQIGYNAKSFAKNAYKVYVDIDNDELNKPTLRPDLKIRMDAKDFLLEFDNLIDDLKIDEWRDACKNYIKLYPTFLDKHKNSISLNEYYVFNKISQKTNKDWTFITGGGGANVRGMQAITLKEGQRLFTNKAVAPMGYGVPASIGAYYGNAKKIFCIEGDGGMQMNVQELQVLSQYSLPIKIIVVNNDGYSCIKLTQRAFCNNNLTVSNPESGLTLPDYSKIANAYNIKYRKIVTNDDLEIMINDVIINEEYNGPELIEIFVDTEAPHEPKVMAKMGNDGKIIPGELENIDWLL